MLVVSDLPCLLLCCNIVVQYQLFVWHVWPWLIPVICGCSCIQDSPSLAWKSFWSQCPRLSMLTKSWILLNRLWSTVSGCSRWSSESHRWRIAMMLLMISLRRYVSSSTSTTGKCGLNKRRPCVFYSSVNLIEDFIFFTAFPDFDCCHYWRMHV